MSQQFTLILLLFVQCIAAQSSITTRYIDKKAEENYLSSILSGSLSNNLVVDTAMTSGASATADYSSSTGAIVNSYVSLVASPTDSVSFYSTGSSDSDSKTKSRSSTESSKSNESMMTSTSDYGSMMTSASESSSASSTSSLTTTVKKTSKNAAVANKYENTGALLSLGIWAGLLFA